jgi:prepilin-type N-terminal cleavage/methylation domain-containing protein
MTEEKKKGGKKKRNLSKDEVKKMKKCRKCRGFTLIELVVVLVIIGILSVIAVPMYRGYIRRAMASEGRALLGSVATGERVYYAEHTGYGTIADTTDSGQMDIDVDGNKGDIDVDARMNTYFTHFSAAGNVGSFNSYTTGTGDASGIAVAFTQPANNFPMVTVTGI